MKTRIFGLLMMVSQLPLFFTLQGLYGVGLFLGSTILMVLFRGGLNSVFLCKLKVINYSLISFVLLSLAAGSFYYFSGCVPGSDDYGCGDIVGIWGDIFIITSVPLGFYVYFTNDFRQS